MAMLARAIAQRSAAKSVSLRELLQGTTGWLSSSSGKSVTVDTALMVATVFACLRVRANGVAQVPLKLMRESADGVTRLPAKDHPLYDILANRPNGWQTSFEYREMLMFHLGLCGVHYSFINRVSRNPKNGKFGSHIGELIPFEPGQVTPKRADDWTLSFDVRGKSGGVQTFPAESIWYVRGPSWDSWSGLEIVRLARETIGLSMAIEEQQSRLQRNSVRPSGIYSVEGKLGDGQYKELKEWIDKEWAGPENAAKAMVLDRSAKWFNTSFSAVDSQTLDTRRFQVEEMCRELGVNPILVFAESKNTTYASAAQMFLSHLVHTLAPDYSRLEQSIYSNLLTDDDRSNGLYANFVEEGMLRGSAGETKDVLLGYVNGGLITPNEGRAKLDLNPDPDPASNKLRIPANIVGTIPESKPAPSAGNS